MSAGKDARPLGRSFHFLWWGQAFSLTGNSVQSIALPLWVWSVTHSGLAAGTAFALETLPVVILAPWAGFIADRYERRSVLLLSELASAFAVALLIIAVHLESVAGAYLIIVAIRSLNTVSSPASQAIIRTTVPKDGLPRATGALEALFGATRMLGPVAGTALAGTMGFEAALWLNLASFVISAVLTAGITRCPGTPTIQRPAAAMLATARNAARNRALVRVAVAECGYFLLFGGAAAVTLLMLQKEAGTASAGLYASGSGAGWLLASVFVVRRFGKSPRTLLLAAGAGCGPLALLIVAGLHTSVALVFVVGMLAGAVNVLVGGGATLLYQAHTPATDTGRVFALRRAVTNTSLGLSNVILTAIAATSAGPETTLVLFGMTATAGVLALIWHVPTAAADGEDPGDSGREAAPAQPVTKARKG